MKASLSVVLVVSLTMLFLTACTKKTDNQTGVGSDKDAHGCVGSAGYLWCAKENTCVRTWEIAKDRGFQNTERDFKKYCGSVSTKADKGQYLSIAQQPQD